MVGEDRRVLSLETSNATNCTTIEASDLSVCFLNETKTRPYEQILIAHIRVGARTCRAIQNSATLSEFR